MKATNDDLSWARRKVRELVMGCLRAEAEWLQLLANLIARRA